jgi:cell division protein ZapD
MLTVEILSQMIQNSRKFSFSDPGGRVIIYEYPFNERIRTLLRLEDLFHKGSAFLERDGPQEHHVVLLTLFEILDVAGRADLKMDLIQELERQRQSLLSFRNNPAISEAALAIALGEIENASSALLGMAGKIGQHLRDNDWLMSIKSRASIPGGVCEFDLPSYHYWRHQAAGIRRDAPHRLAATHAAAA